MDKYIDPNLLVKEKSTEMKLLQLLLLIAGLLCLAMFFKMNKKQPSKILSVVEEHASDLPPCGQVCSYSGNVIDLNAKYYPRLQKQINCGNIMKRMAYRHQAVIFPPPRYPPRNLLDAFTMSGAMPITQHWYFQPDLNKTQRIFNMRKVESMKSSVKSGREISSYKNGFCVEESVAKYAKEIHGKNAVVIGTISPWLESIILANGAMTVTTLEYAEITSRHDQILTHTPYDFAELYINGKSHLFDFGASFSSLEHSGLGRYTDPLNPYGDLEAMAQIYCMVKPGAVFILGVPFSTDNSSSIVWNAHRIYGANRLQHLTANWDVLNITPCKDFHSVIVLRKP